jgi:hypothetical protein
MATSTIKKEPIVVNNLTTTAEGYVLDARQGKQIKTFLDTAHITNTGNGSGTWAFGYAINGVGVIVPIMSGMSINLTGGQILNDKGAYQNLTGGVVANYNFMRCIRFDMPSANVTNGKAYLVTISASVS